MKYDDVLYAAGVRGVVEYTYDGVSTWLLMAAFDSFGVADRYKNKCAEGARVFQYRARELTEVHDDQ